MKKTIYCYDSEGNFIKSYDSQYLTESDTGVLQTNISKCCRGERNTAGGYYWSFIKYNNYLTKAL